MYHSYDAMALTSDDRFATEPAIAAQTDYQRLDEKTLHTLFEQAINSRLETVSRQLRRCSGALHSQLPEAGIQRTYQQKADMFMLPVLRHRSMGCKAWLNHVWQRRVIFASLALLLLLAGFDLMGVLVLRLH